MWRICQVKLGCEGLMRREIVKGTSLHTEFSSRFCESGKLMNIYASLLMDDGNYDRGGFVRIDP